MVRCCNRSSEAIEIYREYLQIFSAVIYEFYRQNNNVYITWKGIALKTVDLMRVRNKIQIEQLEDLESVFVNENVRSYFDSLPWFHTVDLKLKFLKKMILMASMQFFRII